MGVGRCLSPLRLSALVALVLLAPAFAGCVGGAKDEPGSEPLTPGSTSTGSGSGSTGGSTSTGAGGSGATATPPRPKSSAERWHFHDYWKNTPVITLLDANLSLTPAVDANGVPGLGALVELPQGTIVPPETGYLTLNVTWEGAPGGAMNLTYRPADSNDFLPAGDLSNGIPFVLPTTESMCDVPHRQQSFWRFNLTAAVGGMPPAPMASKDLRFVITANIGRPLFIDPPHVNWWQDRQTIPLVEKTTGEFQGVSAADKNLTIPNPLGGQPASVARPAAFTQPQRVSVSEGRIVPEGAKSVVVALTWKADAPPGAKLKVAWSEGNAMTNGTMEVVAEGEGGRVFAIPLTPGQTDTTYSNRTTWEFRVLPDGDPPAFRGAYEFVAWASKLGPADAVADAMGGGA